MGTVFAVGAPTRKWTLRPATEVSITLVHRTPGLTLTAYLQIKELAQVMTERSNKSGVLPTRAVTRATETINSAVWLPFHEHVALELLQSLQRDFERMTVQPTGLRMVVPGAGWQV